MCAPAYGKSVEPTTKAAKRLQTLLGEVHDCDVWIDNLAAFIDDERKRTQGRPDEAEPLERIETGVRGLIDFRRKSRAKLFRAAAAHWRRTSKLGIWSGFRELVDSREKGPAPPKPRAPRRKVEKQGRRGR
jgi:hypothetical protein